MSALKQEPYSLLRCIRYVKGLVQSERPVPTRGDLALTTCLLRAGVARWPNRLRAYGCDQTARSRAIEISTRENQLGALTRGEPLDGSIGEMHRAIEGLNFGECPAHPVARKGVTTVAFFMRVERLQCIHVEQDVPMPATVKPQCRILPVGRRADGSLGSPLCIPCGGGCQRRAIPTNCKDRAIWVERGSGHHAFSGCGGCGEPRTHWTGFAIVHETGRVVCW